MEYSIGTITKILDPDLYTVEVDIPGRNQELRAFPKRGEVDEPRVGDVVVLLELDPTYKSYYLYEKLKENNFIGIRSRGKMIKMTESELTIGIFDPASEYNDKQEKDTTPEPTSWIKIDKSGNINIKTDGKLGLTVEGSAEIECKGSATIKAPNVKITGGKLETKGTAGTDMSGPFNCIPTCPFTGAPHSGSIVSGT